MLSTHLFHYTPDEYSLTLRIEIFQLYSELNSVLCFKRACKIQRREQIPIENCLNSWFNISVLFEKLRPILQTWFVNVSQPMLFMQTDILN